jgi:hypothetical protein
MEGFSRKRSCDRWASGGFPLDIVCAGELHAAFLNESRTRGRWWRPGIRVAHLFRAPVRLPPATLRQMGNGGTDRASLTGSVIGCGVQYNPPQHGTGRGRKS